MPEPEESAQSKHIHLDTICTVICYIFMAGGIAMKLCSKGEIPFPKGTPLVRVHRLLVRVHILVFHCH